MSLFFVLKPLTRNVMLSTQAYSGKRNKKFR